MPNRTHGLTRNSENEPVCICGFRPEILDTDAPIGRLWKAKGIVLDHAASLNCSGAPGGRFPRASVRPTGGGKWHLTLWDAPDVQHELPGDSEFADLRSAFEYGWLRIGACRVSGTTLSGREVHA
ncbi:hypothetical protein SEA_GUSANITA_47 [Arthrobacter phage Gusanita]|nr:hypothetical protein SEA_GUSANITA_47 [Arthrobacter phage Gusanita]